MHLSQVNQFAWLMILKFCSIQLFWIFLFAVLCVTTFLMIQMYKHEREELKKHILPDDCSASSENTSKCLNLPQNSENLWQQIQLITPDLSGKAHDVLNELPCPPVNETTAAVAVSIRDRYQRLLRDLKADLRRTETEVESLQGQVINVSRRRENLKNDLLSLRVSLCPNEGTLRKENYDDDKNNDASDSWLLSNNNNCLQQRTNNRKTLDAFGKKSTVAATR